MSINHPNTPPLMLRSSPDNHQIHLASQEMDFDDAVEDERRLLCLNCRAPITSRDQEISVNDAHLHIFSNPAGAIFRIGCFASAAGCLFHGESTTLHSWFAGYAWQYADCASCHYHLGWQFINQETTHCFSGLIISRLTTGKN